MTRRLFIAESATAAAALPQASDVRDAKAPPRRNLLAGRWPADKLAKALLPAASWRPFPKAADRAAWEALPEPTRTALIEAGQKALGEPWPSLPAALFLEFKRNGNRSRFEAVSSARRARLRSLVLAECVEGKGRFLDEITNGLWLVCEETWWGYPAHMSLQKQGNGLPDVAEPVIDLFAAETAALLAWTEYLMAAQLDTVHPLVAERIRLEVRRRIIEVFRGRDDFWWMGLNPRTADRPMNNWNPWINSNCLTCGLLLESDPSRRAQFVHKVLRSVDRFIDSYEDDGGCDEGPGYWGHAGGSLFDNLELLHSASNGAVDFYSVPVVREIGRYIYRAHIAGNWFVNFADASPRISPAGDLIFRYGRRIGDPAMESFGAWAAQQAGPARGDALGRYLPALFNRDIAQATPRAPLVREVWLPGIQVMASRMKEGSAEGLYLAAQGGHNAESHNHNDVGNFIVYANGEPVLIDVGVETYTAKTFSPRRYEIWTMQSAYHNLPTVNGVMQAAGRQFAARAVSCAHSAAAAEFSLDIAGAYPPEAGLTAWRRTLRLDRPAREVEVRDRYALSQPGGRIELTLMTPCEVKLGDGVIQLAGRAEVFFDREKLKPAVEEIAIEDARLRPVWGPRLYRILLKAEKVPAQGEFILRVR